MLLSYFTYHLSPTPTGIATDPPPAISPTMYSRHQHSWQEVFNKTGSIHNVSIHNVAGNILNVLFLSWLTFWIMVAKLWCSLSVLWKYIHIGAIDNVACNMLKRQWGSPVEHKPLAGCAKNFETPSQPNYKNQMFGTLTGWQNLVFEIWSPVNGSQKIMCHFNKP